jgi:hypothetical protein
LKLLDGHFGGSDRETAIDLHLMKILIIGTIDLVSG